MRRQYQRLQSACLRGKLPLRQTGQHTSLGGVLGNACFVLHGISVPYGVAPAGFGWEGCGVVSLSGADRPEESRRATIAAQTPDGDKCTLIVVRWGYGRTARLVLSVHGVRETTAILDATTVAELLCDLAYAAPLTTATATG
jgi:hypothetical protein